MTRGLPCSATLCPASAARNIRMDKGLSPDTITLLEKMVIKAAPGFLERRGSNGKALGF